MRPKRLDAGLHVLRRHSDRGIYMVNRRALAMGVLTILTNVVPAAALFVYLQFMDPGAAGIPNPYHARHLVLVGFVAFLVVAVPLGVATSIAAYAPIARWLSTNRPATATEQLLVLRQPVERAMGTFSSWAIGGLLFGILEAALGYPARRVLLTVTGVLLAGLASSSLTALVVERVMRPVAARALAGNPPKRRLGIRVLPRLLLSWAFGSAVPLIGLLLAPLDQGTRTLHSFAGPLLFLCLAGLASGFTITTGAARAVSEPLATLRQALERVEAGDLTVEVTVDDGGEVGQLQAGVNRMVVGLRQQRDLEDLFGRLVGTEVAAQALDRGGHLGGERRVATVLFVDLIGSTALAASLTPEAVVRSLNNYFSAVVGAVAANGGWVNKFQGDGALCVFGPPGGASEHARSALRTARDIQAGVEAASSGRRLEAAIGVSTGVVVAGNIGSLERFEYTVIGDPVNEAARLTALAKSAPGRILASGTTIDAAGDEAAHWRASGTVTLRGRSAPTELYHVIDDGRDTRSQAARPDAARPDAAAAGSAVGDGREGNAPCAPSPQTGASTSAWQARPTP